MGLWGAWGEDARAAVAALGERCGAVAVSGDVWFGGGGFSCCLSYPKGGRGSARVWGGWVSGGAWPGGVLKGGGGRDGWYRTKGVVFQSCEGQRIPPISTGCGGVGVWGGGRG